MLGKRGAGRSKNDQLVDNRLISNVSDRNPEKRRSTSRPSGAVRASDRCPNGPIALYAFEGQLYAEHN